MSIGPLTHVSSAGHAYCGLGTPGAACMESSSHETANMARVLRSGCMILCSPCQGSELAYGIRCTSRGRCRVQHTHEVVRDRMDNNQPLMQVRSSCRP